MNPYLNKPFSSSYVPTYVSPNIEAVRNATEQYGKVLDQGDEYEVKLNSLISSQKAIPIQEEQERIKAIQQDYGERIKNIAKDLTAYDRLKGLNQLVYDFEKDERVNNIINNKKAYDEYATIIKDNPEKDELLKDSLALYRLQLKQNPNATFTGIIPINRKPVIEETIKSLKERGLFDTKEISGQQLIDGKLVTVKSKDFTNRTENPNWYNERVLAAAEHLTSQFADQYRHDALREIARTGSTLDPSIIVKQMIEADAKKVVDNQLETLDTKTIEKIKTINNPEYKKQLEEIEYAKMLTSGTTTNITLTQTDEELSQIDTFDKLQKAIIDVDTFQSDPEVQAVVNGKDDALSFDSTTGTFTVKDGLTGEQRNEAVLRANAFNAKIGRMRKIKQSNLQNILAVANQRFSKQYNLYSKEPFVINSETKQLQLGLDSKNREYLIENYAKQKALKGDDYVNTNIFFKVRDEKEIKDNGFEKLDGYENIYFKKEITDTRSGVLKQKVSIIVKDEDANGQTVFRYVSKGEDFKAGSISEHLENKLKADFTEEIKKTVNLNFKDVPIVVPKYNLSNLRESSEDYKMHIKGLEKELLNADRNNKEIIFSKIENGKKVETTDANMFNPTSKSTIEINDFVPETETGEPAFTFVHVNAEGKQEHYYVHGPAVTNYVQQHFPELYQNNKMSNLFIAALGDDVKLNDEQGFVEKGEITSEQLSVLGYGSSKNEPIYHNGVILAPFKINLARHNDGTYTFTGTFETDLNTDVYKGSYPEQPPYTVSAKTVSELTNAYLQMRTYAEQLGKKYLRSQAPSQLSEQFDQIFSEDVDFGLDDYLEELGTVESSNNDRAQSSTSSAAGRFQITESTYNRIRDNNPSIIPPNSTHADMLNSAELQALAIRLYTIDTANSLKRSDLPITKTNLYLMHHFDPDLAKQMIKDVRAGRHLDKTFAEYIETYRPGDSRKENGIIRSNPGHQNKTFAEFIAWVGSKFSQ